MKVKRASYLDDGVFIHGVLIERMFRRPVFYSADARCGWQSQVIHKDNEKNLFCFMIVDLEREEWAEKLKQMEN